MNKNVNSITTSESSSEHANRIIPQLPSVRIIQNFLLVWLDENINDINNIDRSNTIAKIHEMINSINIFSDPDQCIDFITDMDKEKAFMIISESLSGSIIPVIQEISQISSIYILSQNNTKQVQSAKQCVKVKGIFTDITYICEALKRAARERDQNSITMSFIASDTVKSKRLDQLDQSFMYTQILKEILLTTDFEQEHIQNFITYCRKQFVGNKSQLENINKFEQEYRHQTPIWWYTHQFFIYSVLNRALRTMEVDITINMGFFVRDLHEHIVQLHSEQYSSKNHVSSFVVYRGQGLNHTDFDQLLKTQGGLMSFNNFLSTSSDPAVSLAFAESNEADPELIVILFQITIHSSISSTSFANIRDISHYKEEEEILFLMHSVFRIEDVNPINNNKRLWQVNLTLTDDADPELHILAEYVRLETFPTQKGWYRLGQLLIKLGQYNKAEQIYTTLLNHTSDSFERAKIYHQLVCIYNQQGSYAEAIRYYEKSNEILQNNLPPNDLALAASYATIGSVYENMGDYSTAISYYEKDLVIVEKIVPPNYLSIATSYNNIGLLYDKMDEYSKALLYHEKALEIRRNFLPSNHPDLAQTYSNMGRIYLNIGQHSKALWCYEKTLEIREKILPLNHPSLTTSYNGIGLVYKKMGQYSKALSYHKKALEIGQAILPPNHPDLAALYSNIASVYENMGDYSKAISYYEKDLTIVQNALPPNHPDVATSFNNIGLLCDKMGEYSKALSYHEKALQIYQNTFPLNHSGMIISYNNIGGVYSQIGQHSKALSYGEKALEIARNILPSNHSDLAIYYNNIGLMYSNVGENSRAFACYERALEIRQNILPPNHPDLILSYNNIGNLYLDLGDYSKALSYLEKACEICQNTLPSNHPDLATCYNSIGFLCLKMGSYEKALSNYEKAFEIRQKILPSNHPQLDSIRTYIELLKKKL